MVLRPPAALAERAISAVCLHLLSPVIVPTNVGVRANHRSTRYAERESDGIACRLMYAVRQRKPRFATSFRVAGGGRPSRRLRTAPRYECDPI